MVTEAPKVSREPWGAADHAPEIAVTEGRACMGVCWGVRGLVRCEVKVVSGCWGFVCRLCVEVGRGGMWKCGVGLGVLSSVARFVVCGS